MACTGIEFCKLAIVETKGRARELYTELERRLPDFDTPITINVNGCPNSCARFQLADIGLKGSIVDGTEGFQVHLGGSLGTDPSFGRKLRGLKVTADGLTDYVERLLRSYQADRTDGRGVRRLGAPGRREAAAPRPARPKWPAGQPGRCAMSERQVPFFCPYCGEETLRPVGARRGRVGVRGVRPRVPAALRGRHAAAAPRPATGLAS